MFSTISALVLKNKIFLYLNSAFHCRKRQNYTHTHTHTHTQIHTNTHTRLRRELGGGEASMRTKKFVQRFKRDFLGFLGGKNLAIFKSNS